MCYQSYAKQEKIAEYVFYWVVVGTTLKKKKKKEKGTPNSKLVIGGVTESSLVFV